jgi:hypothetical protein
MKRRSGVNPDFSAILSFRLPIVQDGDTSMKNDCPFQMLMQIWKGVSEIGGIGVVVGRGVSVAPASPLREPSAT